MKIKIAGWLYAQASRSDGLAFYFFNGSSTNFWISQGYIPLCEHTIEADAPDVDVVEGQVQCLIAKKEALKKEFERESSKIDDALSRLKCLTFDKNGVAS